MNKKDMDFLRKKQELPLKNKVALTEIKVKHFYNAFNGDVYVSFSGGKDSTVLLDIARNLYSNIPIVFSNTGLEYPEIVEFVKTFIKDSSKYNEVEVRGHKIRHYEEDNVFIIRPKYSFKEVIEKEGYPILSKRTSRFIKDLQNPTENNKVTRQMRMTGNMANGGTTTVGKLAEKWKEKFFDIEDEENLIYENKVDFKVSNRCCNLLKKQPFKALKSEFNLKPIIGTLANESYLRKNRYLNSGCNVYDSKNPRSAPLSFWTEQDILEYLYTNDLPYSSIYGEIIKEKDSYKLTGEQRTGCVFCAFGAHLEDEPNRFQRLKKTHPKLYKYAMDNLGMKEVLDFIDVPYK
jgi:3'-phosphoadenosine 5'-phosphosulfate sulfotransferase (PAPS reductase)/FAD synthetase